MNKIRPIIKWTGGKFSEFALFSEYIPSFERYIEPFFGGGGVFFALQPSTPSFINDKSSDLIDFYQTLKSKKLKGELIKYADAWDELGKLSTDLWSTHGQDYIGYNRGELDAIQPELTANLKFELLSREIFNDERFIIDPPSFMKTVLASVAEKARRIKNITINEDRLFTSDELKSHFETGIKSGVYMFFRSLLNQYYQKKRELNVAKAVANWYFVRELCYGSMFRFNKKGNFNIPYGGIAYNRKKFRKKVTAIFSSAIEELFNQTTIYNLDFEKFLKRIDVVSTDFIFLDPPYDSEFSEYDQSSFTQHDQQRLANFLFGTSAKWMVVIKETAYIRDLYTRDGVNIIPFSKNYRYNVRGRNIRTVQHLIITNY